ncbi:MAG TPA: EF-hand domain-containing protein [Methylotenera sp.]
MKTLQILAISSLLLGLSQTANADHHEMNHDHAGAHAHNWQDADANKDGIVSKDEFMAKHQERAEKMFSKMDGNKDGKVDEAERKAMHDKCDRHAK